MKFVFYDTETTGLSSAYDQILQFAGIVTDSDFNILEEVDLRCRPWPHILPSPTALRITGIRLSDAMAAKLSPYEMAGQIQGLIRKHSPCTFIGFNSIGYDEGMLRNAFYQTLHPIYATNMNGNSRMDVLRLAHAVHEQKPGVIHVPNNEKGNLSFKLELLAKANGLDHANAHDAMSDTRATLSLAKMIRDNAPQIWAALNSTRSKSTTRELIRKNPILLHTERMFSSPTIPVTKTAQNPDNDNEIAFFDLTHDPRKLFDLPINEIPKLLTGKDRAIRVIKANANPILIPLQDANWPDGNEWPDENTLLDRAKWIRESPDFSRAVAYALSNRFEDRQSPTRVDERIYDGFYSKNDQRLIEEFHRLSWNDRYALCDRFSDERLSELSKRLLYMEDPSSLPIEVRNHIGGQFRQRLLSSDKVPWGTIEAVKAEICEFRKEENEQVNAMLDDYEACMYSHINRILDDPQ